LERPAMPINRLAVWVVIGSSTAAAILVGLVFSNCGISRFWLVAGAVIIVDLFIMVEARSLFGTLSVQKLIAIIAANVVVLTASYLYYL
jgi:hypothetical protein